MAANKLVTFGPVALSNTLTTNILNPPTTTGGVGAGTPNTYLVLRHIRIVNKTAGAATFSLWLGATGANTAGTEVIGTALSVPANSAFDWYGQMAIDTTQFLDDGASATTTLTFQAEGEIGL